MYVFGDSFDLYASQFDIQNFWDTYNNGFGPPGLVAGRFSGGQGFDMTATNCSMIKASGHNDAVHHLTFAVKLNNALSGTTLGTPAITLRDGANNQCSIVFRTDGAILLTSGAYNGTVLDTYLGAVTAQSQWFVFEIEVVINNTTGSWTVRKNGNVGTPDHTLSGLNTRAGTTNNYANTLFIGWIGGSFVIDDVLWRSDASSVPWVGDIRCYTRMPASDQSVQFSKVVPNKTITNTITSSGQWTAGYTMYTPFTATVTGYVATVAQVTGTGAITGHIKCALFADNAGLPGAVIATSSTIVPGIAGGQATGTFTFGPGANVTNGQQYWIGVCGDTTGASNSFGQLGSTGCYYVGTYAAFPVSNASPTVATTLMAGNIVITPTTNAAAVNEAHQDALTSYVFDSNVGDADFYNISSLSVVPASTVAVTTRQFAQKSDTVSKSGMVQLKSGSTTVNSGSAGLNTAWTWSWRTDLTDPATSAAWTATGVNNAQVGPTVTA